MQSAQPSSHFFKLSLLCLSLTLAACQKDEKQETVKTQNKIELIQQDLVPIQQGSAVSKTAFTGTIRAVQQSSIQAQVTATATNVTAEVGQQVHKGQILVHLNNQDNASRLAQAQANLASTQAQANQAHLMMERKQRLLNQGFISKVEFEQSRVDYQGQMESVRAQQANVDIARKANQDGIIYSPISGVITKREVEPGQTVSAGQTLFEIVNPDRLEIQAKLPSDMQAALKIGQKIEYTIQGNSNVLTANVNRISPIADQTSRQIEFFAQPNEAITSLSIGSFVDGSLVSAQSISGQQIPLDTIQNVKDNPYVWVIRQNKIAKAPIQILNQSYSNNTAIVQGLQNSDLISRVKFNDEDIQQVVSIAKN